MEKYFKQVCFSIPHDIFEKLEVHPEQRIMAHFKGLLKASVISLDEKITIEYPVCRGVGP